MARQLQIDDGNGLVKRFAADLDRPGYPWWQTAAWARLRSEHPHHEIVRVLEAFTRRLEAGDDPLFVMGGSTGAAAVDMAREWIAAEEHERVERWLTVSMWSPDRARAIWRSGIDPEDFIDAEGELVVYDTDDLVPLPLAEYVCDGTVSAEDAKRLLKGPAS